MKKLILSFSGLESGRFVVPAFEVYDGELVTLCLYGGAHFYPLSLYLENIFSGAIQHESVKIYSAIAHAPLFKQSKLARMLFPMTVGRYIKNKKIENKDLINHILLLSKYNNQLVTYNTKMSDIGNAEKMQVALCGVFQHTNKVVFCLGGQSAGTIQTLDFVKAQLGETGAAIILDNFDDTLVKEKSSKFLQVSVKDKLA